MVAGWGPSLPFYDILMAKYALGFKRPFELKPVFVHTPERCTSNIPHFTRFHKAAIILEHAHRFLSNSILVTRKNQSRLSQTCHPLYCISSFYKKGSTLLSSRVRGFHSYDQLFFWAAAQVHCSPNPFYGTKSSWLEIPRECEVLGMYSLQYRKHIPPIRMLLNNHYLGRHLTFQRWKMVYA